MREKLLERLREARKGKERFCEKDKEYWYFQGEVEAYERALIILSDEELEEQLLYSR